MWYGPLSLTSNLGKLTVKVAVMLFYDMFLTFGDEVEKIWTQPFSLAQVLWFVVRMLLNINYLTSHFLEAFQTEPIRHTSWLYRRDDQ